MFLIGPEIAPLATASPSAPEPAVPRPRQALFTRLALFTQFGPARRHGAHGRMLGA